MRERSGGQSRSKPEEESTLRRASLAGLKAQDNTNRVFAGQEINDENARKCFANCHFGRYVSPSIDEETSAK